MKNDGEFDPRKLILVYFDVTDAYKKLKSRNKENREKIKEIEE